MEARQGPRARRDRHSRRSWAAALAAVLASFVALAVLFLSPYLLNEYHYPIAWGAATYVAKARSAAEEGLALLGTIRPAGSLLLAVLMRATGENAFTLVGVAPALLAGAAGLGGAAIVRAGLGAGAFWVPVVAFLTWAAFVRVGVMSFHFDHLANAALVLPALGAAVAYGMQRRAALAALLLLGAAALAHWPFALYATGILAVAVAMHVWVPLGVAWSGWPSRLREMWGLVAVAAATVVTVALSLLSPPPTGWIGVRLRPLASRLGERFARRITTPATYAAVPFAVAGAAAAVLSATPSSRSATSRRLFLALMSSWVVLTVGMSVLQQAGITTAADRLLQSFFALTILSGVATWWFARRLAARRPGWLGLAAAAVLVLSVVVGFGTFTARWWNTRTPMIDPDAVQQVATAGDYLARVAPDRSAFVLVTGGLDWWVTQAALPPDQLDRVFPYYRPPARFLAGELPKRFRKLRFGPAPESLGEAPIGIVLRAFDANRFLATSETVPDGIVGPGVLVLNGPRPPQPLVARPPERADLRPVNLATVSLATVALLVLVGAGWALALVPPDPVLRATLAPGLGAAAIVLAATGWGLLGLALSRPGVVAVLAVAAAPGWLLAAATRGLAGRAAPAVD